MPPSKIGRCTVFGELAAGGMATVYVGRLAGAAGFARRVAIKSLHAQYAKDPDFLAMFLDEARLSGRIQHPNVVRVLDVISSVSELHLVMEYIEGESLSKLSRLLRARGEQMPVAIAVAILCGVLDGLHAAHEARAEDGHALQIVHRDVSPQNVLVGVDGMPRILDFGIAKAVGRMQTTRGDQLKGKLSYMAPEHLAREPLDRRADIYAAGIVLWQLLTDQRLFQADDEISTFRLALEAKVVAPSLVAPRVPQSLDAAVLRALAKDPTQRYPTAGDFSRALEATGLSASVRELATWVSHTAGESLAGRAARIAGYEAALSGGSSLSVASDTDGTSTAAIPRALSERLRSEQADTALLASSQPASTSQQRPRAAWAWLSLPALASFALVGGWLLRTLPPSAPLAPAASARTATALGDGTGASFGDARDAAVGASPATLPATPSAVGPASLASAPSQASSRAPSPAPPRAASARSGGGAKMSRGGCETPFTVDARGIRVPKLECL